MVSLCTTNDERLIFLGKVGSCLGPRSPIKKSTSQPKPEPKLQKPPAMIIPVILPKNNDNSICAKIQNCIYVLETETRYIGKTLPAAFFKRFPLSIISFHLLEISLAWQISL